MILIDTSEQQPLIPIVYRQGKPVELPHVFKSLETGDYSVEGLEHMVSVERKGNDLWSTLYGKSELANGDDREHLERFREELERMKKFERRWWLVEYPMSDFKVYAERRRFRWKAAGGKGRPPPDFYAAHSLLCAIACDYNIPLYWADSRQDAAHFLGCTLGRIAEQHRDPKAAKKARGRNLELPWLHSEAP